MGKILFVVLSIGVFWLIIRAHKIQRNNKRHDRKDIETMSDEELLIDYKRTNYQLGQLPKVLMHVDIYTHKRLINKLSMILKEIEKRELL